MKTPKFIGRHWYVAASGYGQAFEAKEELIAAGFEVYMPIERVMRTRRRKRVPIDVPLFDEYLFVQVDGDAFPDIRAIYGLERILGAPTPVPWVEVENLRTAEARGLFDDTKPKNKIIVPLKAGEPVNVIAGPFTGFVGEVMRAKGKNRVKVLLRLFGRDLEINIETGYLKKTGP